VKNEPNNTRKPKISCLLSLKAQLGGWMLAILEVFCKWEYICIEKLAVDLSLSWGAVII
jgi:hypothetical protein